MSSDVKLSGNLHVKSQEVDMGDANFALETSIQAVLEHSEHTDMLALEIGFTLKGRDEEIPKDSWVWMYTSLGEKGSQGS